jgi:hypothetical protein
MRRNGRPEGRTFFETAPDLDRRTGDRAEFSMVEEDTCEIALLA